MTFSGFVSWPLLLVQLTAAGWGIYEAVRLVAEWRRTGLAGDAVSTLVVIGGVVMALWLDGLFTRARLLGLPGGVALHEWLGLVLLWLGLGLRAWAHAILGDLYTTTVLIQPRHHLVSSGPYRWMRHPSYVGLCLSLLGFALVGGSGASLFMTALVLVVVFAYRIPAEERVLRAEFGAEYDAYAAHTRRILPGVF